MKVILSTRNPSKAEQIKQMFVGMPIEIFSLDEAGIEGEAIEDGTTLQENAWKKARYALDNYKDNGDGGILCSRDIWAIADDTGLFITCLDGQPGIKAARWAGETAQTHEITAHTLAKMNGTADRSAVFETYVVLMSHRGDTLVYAGKAPGTILESQRCMPQPKMPYSGIFVPDADPAGRCWAEMSVEEENAISHRGKAFRQAREHMEVLARFGDRD